METENQTIYRDFFPVKDEIDYNQVKIDDDFPQKSKSGLRASDIIFRKIPKLALEPPALEPPTAVTLSLIT